ncbi:hypothetical protein DENIS_4380 [Desulfonema ishimotonii]|uniref:Uncharacterized protein n=1 Tax=Desulfonema ishimotonii TaxID=45657 RepID=A0A401G2E8_9BACT|nr:hypothetical protein [Desulfonema ishimotonii]GBC63386.1 hypothetical protein DENIS_4380 [Desulfonema ishimotonii]
MLDVSVAYNRYKFLGYEFLTWVWFVVEKDRALLRKFDPELLALDIGNRVMLENSMHDATESVTIKGDDAGLEEGVLALRKGAVVTELNLIYQSGDHEWRFTLKGESFNIAGLRTPETAPPESKDDIEGIILEKVYLCEKVMQLVDNMFNYYIKLRISDEWTDQVLPELRKWIHN